MHSDITLTRIGLAEHAYPAPTRRIMVEHNSNVREACPIRSGRKTVATDVVTYRIKPDGSRVRTDISRKRYSRTEELALMQAERKARLLAIVQGTQAQIDTWADKH